MVFVQKVTQKSQPVYAQQDAKEQKMLYANHVLSVIRKVVWNYPQLNVQKDLRPHQVSHRVQKATQKAQPVVVRKDTKDQLMESVQKATKKLNAQKDILLHQASHRVQKVIQKAQPVVVQKDTWDQQIVFVLRGTRKFLLKLNQDVPNAISCLQ